jgi:hypothetical protein
VDHQGDGLLAPVLQGAHAGTLDDCFHEFFGCELRIFRVVGIGWLEDLECVIVSCGVVCGESWRFIIVGVCGE